MNIQRALSLVILPIIYISGWVLLYNLPRRLFHVAGDTNIEGWLLYFLMFLLLPFVLYKILNRNNLSKGVAKGIAYASVFLALPFVFYISSEDANEFEEYKAKVKGVINEAIIRKRRRGNPPIWTVKAQYEVNGLTYQTSSKDDPEKNMQLGNTVTIWYSSKTPEMSEITELSEHYKK